MPKPGYCQNDSGILDGSKLTPGARASFIKDVKDLLIFSDAGVKKSLVQVGPDIPPVPGADKIALEDQQLYPAFHEQWVGTYEKIAVFLDFPSQLMFAPVVMDPVALTVKLGLSSPSLKFPDEFLLYGTALPLLAQKLGIVAPPDIAEFTAKVPTVVVPAPPIPNIAGLLPPPVDPEVFPDLAAHLAWPAKLPKVFLDLALQMPSLFAGILSFDFKVIADTVLNAGIFGTIRPTAFVQIAAVKILIRKTVECVIIAIVGSTVGSAAGGITGALGQAFGYKEKQ